MGASLIHRLEIKFYRKIESLIWSPAKGMNILLGGGDVGKTSILDAIALLLSPVYPTTLSDSEYHDRKVESGFSIEAVMSLSPDVGIYDQNKISWCWDWNGTNAVVPSDEEAEGTLKEPVFRFRVRGTEDLELLYETIRPDGITDSFPVSLRRAIGLVRLGGEERNDRDLRLVHGSSLDRLLSDKGLRSRLASDLSKQEIHQELTEDAKKSLTGLNETFKREKLPGNLALSVTGGQGISIGALIGLTAERDGIQLPLTSWGAGTRRIASLTIAEQKQGEAPIMLIDELERGLEPYRQRLLMNKLQVGTSQIFVTTHSPFVISSASNANLWHVDYIGNVGRLDRKKTDAHRASDPEAFLAYLTILVEGATEKGFVISLLEKALNAPLEQYGIYVADGHGNEGTLGLLEALSEGGLRFGGFADDEQDRNRGR